MDLSEAIKEVLIVYNNRRRAVRFRTAPDPCTEHKNLYDAAEEVFKDIFLLGEGSSSSSHGTAFHLEFESEEWGKQMVGILGSVTVSSKAIVYLRRQFDVRLPTDYIRENVNDVSLSVCSCKSSYI